MPDATCVFTNFKVLDLSNFSQFIKYIFNWDGEKRETVLIAITSMVAQQETAIHFNGHIQEERGHGVGDGKP